MNSKYSGNFRRVDLRLCFMSGEIATRGGVIGKV
jgi:hypothetical protein